MRISVKDTKAISENGNAMSTTMATTKIMMISSGIENYFDAGDRREELVGIAFNRLMKMSLPGGDHLTTWRYNTVKVFFNNIIKSIIHISSPPNRYM